MENLNNPTGPPGNTTKADINHVTTKKNIPEPKNTHKPNPSNPPIKEQQRTYSDVIRSGLQPEHPHMKVVAFESMWLSAKPPSTPINNFPCRIEGLTPSIWHALYKRESNHFHAPFKSCLLCNRIDRIINEISKCHRSALSPECPDCQIKRTKAKYLNREWLADIHTKSLSSLTITKIGGEVKSLRAEAWTNDKNKNKRNEPLSKQMERELSKFSRFRKPTPLQAWVPDKNQPNANKKSLQPTQANLQNKRDTDKEQKTVPLIPDEKPPTEDNNLVTIGETETENITSAKPDPDKKGNSNVTDAKVQQTSAVEILAAVKESDNKDQPTPAVEVLAAVKETTEEPNPLKETQLQSECTENPPISFGGNLENIAWIDADDEPWEYGMQLGRPYNE